LSISNQIEEKTLVSLHGIRVDIVYHKALGVATNTLVIELPEERNILSTRTGLGKAKYILNTHIPPELWNFMHDNSADWQTAYSVVLEEVLKRYGTDLDNVSFLSTGVDQDNIAWAEETYEEFWVLAFATAGVKTNAMRIGCDAASGIERNGKFEKIGTINIILLTGSTLETPTLASSYITLTEAKNVALQELDIRSAVHPELQATGTGTDQIISVSGTGDKYTYVGGHTKLGEMMAKSATRAVRQAIMNCRGY
jgi:adenosylcobinamide amidohydrolase